MRKVYDPPSVMDSNFFHEKSTSQHFLLFSFRQHQTRECWIPWKHEYLVIILKSRARIHSLHSEWIRPFPWGPLDVGPWWKKRNLERKINFAKIRWFGFSFRGALFSRGVGRGLGWISHSLFWVNSDVMKPGMTHNTILEEYMTNMFEPSYSTCLFDHRQNIQLFSTNIF